MTHHTCLYLHVGGSMYPRNVGNILQIHTLQRIESWVDTNSEPTSNDNISDKDSDDA
jgi:hypothetical protein